MKSDNLFLLRACLLMALLPTLLIVALYALAILLDNTDCLAPGWQRRALACLAAFYLGLTALAFFKARSAVKR